MPEGAAKDEGLLKTLLTGMQLTEKELFAAFDRHKIVKLEPLGEKLDPHRHEAMFEVEDPSQPPGTVVLLLEPGYLLHDRLLRPARVGVSKGGPAAAPAPKTDDASTEEDPDTDSPRLDTSA